MQFAVTLLKNESCLQNLETFKTAVSLLHNC